MPAKKPAKSAAKAAPVKKKVEVSKTPVRNTPLPKATARKATPAAAIEVTHGMIAKRAYEIHASGRGGSEHDNWHRAERELRSGL